MRVLVLGAGAIGGYFGGRLAESGADVTFLVRERRRAELAATGLAVTSPAGDIAMPVRTVLAGATGGPYDFVLLSCKSYDLDAAMDAVAPALGPASAVVPLLNGVTHLDRLQERFGAQRTMGGACYVGLGLEADGSVRHVGAMQRLLVGELSGAPSTRAAALAALFARTRSPATLAPDILQAMWEKLVMLAALVAVTTLARATVGEIAAAPGGAAFAVAALEETAAVAAAEGHAPSAEAFANAKQLLTAPGSPFAASTMRDMLAGRRTEGDHIVGELARRAVRHGIAAPILAIARTNLDIHETRVARG